MCNLMNTCGDTIPTGNLLFDRDILPNDYTTLPYLDDVNTARGELARIFKYGHRVPNGNRQRILAIARTMGRKSIALAAHSEYILLNFTAILFCGMLASLQISSLGGLNIFMECVEENILITAYSQPLKVLMQ